MFKKIVSLSLAMLLCLSTLVVSVTAIADVNEKFNFKQNASIRFTEGTTGLRFTSVFDSDTYNLLINSEGEYKDTNNKLHMIIVPQDYLTDYQTGDYYDYLTSNERAIINLEFESNKIIPSAVEGYYQIQGVISNIKENNYNRNFVALSYYLNGEGIKSYSDLSNAQNVVEVALQAKKNTDAIYSENQTNILNGFLAGCSHKDLDADGYCDYCETDISVEKTVSFEAENAYFRRGVRGNLNTGSSSGITYVGNLNENKDAMVKFTFSSNKTTTANLAVYVSLRKVETTFTNNVLVQVNDTEFVSSSVTPASGTGNDAWWTFGEVDLGSINLIEGENTISFTMKSTASTDGYNFDKINLTTLANLQYVAVSHYCDSVCEICGKCLDLDCTENVCAEKCGLIDGTTTKFEAENAVLGSGVKGAPNLDNNNTLVGNLSQNQGASITFNFNSSEATVGNLTVAVTRRNVELLFSYAYFVNVNGENINRFVIVPQGPNASNDWFNSVELYLGCINLKEGENTIVFTVVSTSSSSCFNFDYIKIKSQSEIS